MSSFVASAKLPIDYVSYENDDFPKGQQSIRALTGQWVTSKNTAVSNKTLTREKNMAKATAAEGVSVEWFKWIVGGLLGIITVLLPIIYSNIQGDITDLKNETKDGKNAISKMNVDLVQAIDKVDKQASITNQKLDDLISELRRQKSP